MLSASHANTSHHCLICAYSAQMSTNVYVVHNARKDVGIDFDIWLVIDTVARHGHLQALNTRGSGEGPCHRDCVLRAVADRQPD
jgi:hypothetical protein